MSTFYRSERIRTPIADYMPETYFDHIIGAYAVHIIVEQNQKVIGFITIGHYSSREEAESEYEYWIDTIPRTPPLVLRDFWSNKLLIITI